MTICYFGIYDPEYSRNKILIRGLKQNGVEVIECNSRSKGIKKYFELIKKHWVIRDDYDSMVVGFPGWQAILLARILCQKEIVLDAFFSFHESMVVDRKICKRKSIRAFYYWFLDWFSAKQANKIILDTNEHIEYYKQNLKVSANKLARIFVGADEDVFFQRAAKKQKKFTIHFHGSFIPLQGIKYIVGAINLLKRENILLNIVGNGQEYDKIMKFVQEKKLENFINFYKPVPLSELPDFISKSDLCLGIFGDTPKTKKVIPNKVYECVAMKKPVLTSDTPAIRELFDSKSLLLCETANSKSIAEKIIYAKNNLAEISERAEKAYDIFKNQSSTRELGEQLKYLISK